MKAKMNDESFNYSNDIMKGVWERIQAILKLRNISRGQLAERCSVSPSFFFYGRAPEDGIYRDLSISLIHRICTITNVDFDWLVYGIKHTNNSEGVKKEMGKLGVTKSFVATVLENTMYATGGSDWQAFVMALLPYLTEEQVHALYNHISSFEEMITPEVKTEDKNC